MYSVLYKHRMPVMQTSFFMLLSCFCTVQTLSHHQIQMQQISKYQKNNQTRVNYVICKDFMSLGSIIDVNLIDGKSEYVILQPTDFIRCLDKVFNPKMFIPGVATCVIVTKSIANYIFNADHEFFMNVLVSVDLALELNSNQIVIGSQFA